MKKILVIEDEPTLRSLICDLLETADFIPISAPDGRVGVQLAQEQLPDLILCDVMMPDLDGYDVLTTLRQNLTTAAIPFIFLSAKADKPDIRRGMSLGADDYLTKPFKRDELIEVVQVRLARQDMLNQVYRQPTLGSTQATEEDRLRQAMEQQEFELHYQPQLSLVTGQILGVEALVRWRSPELGMVPPNQFIPLAEKTGLILPLGEWVLDSACAQLQHWQGAGLPPLKMAVNLSSVQFAQADLVNQVLSVLHRYRITPNCLDLELTESLLVQNVDTTIHRLNQLRDIGVQISVDDFGTGYASLGYLQHFPFDVLKLDRCFVQAVDQNTRNAAIATAIIQMAHNLNLKVIAEGVETDAEKLFLTQQHCDAMQGYLFSRPLPVAQIEDLFRTHLSLS